MKLVTILYERECFDQSEVMGVYENLSDAIKDMKKFEEAERIQKRGYTYFLSNIDVVPTGGYKV